MKTQSKIDYEEMMFFDDEQRNISEVGALGVVSVYVTNGVCESVIKEGMDKFKGRQS